LQLAAAQMLCVHTPDVQSPAAIQAWPVAHFGQLVPPQSTPVSAPLTTPSLQLGAKQVF
jgi:hypothetical protein